MANSHSVIDAVQNFTRRMAHSRQPVSRNGNAKTAVVYTHDLAARGGAERVAVVVASVLRDVGLQTYLASASPEISLHDIGDYFDVDLTSVQYLKVPAERPAKRRLAEVNRIFQLTRLKRAILAVEPTVLFNCAFHSSLPGIANVSIQYPHFPHHLASNEIVGGRWLYMKVAAWAGEALVKGSRNPQYTYTRTLANSHFSAENIRQEWSLEAEVLYPPCSPVKPSLTKRSRMILSVGRFQDRVEGRPHKRQDVMIQAFAEMTDLHRTGWKLHLAGSTGSAREIEQLTALARGLPVVFHVDASAHELAELYSRATLYWHAQGFGEALPVAQEHFGISIVEAMSAGAIPIVHGTGGPAEIVGAVNPRLLWTTVAELQATSRRFALEADSERLSLSRSLVRRSHDFSPESFARDVRRILNYSTRPEEG